ncbi:TetR/AcrR family transcriptional regulator [Nocardia sp. NPDC058058]|uniref:TetR/AcrR family transcriptional regulator n=1 Tax=Nocardia sp. NPDC058058 TaxID=3346317 RepID=UPI0036DB38DE
MIDKISVNGRTTPASGSRRRPVQSRAIQTRDHIIEATAQVLARVGYAELSTNAVAERAGIGIGTLYRYFADKEDLITAVRVRTAHRVQTALDASFLELTSRAHPGGPRGAAVAVARAIFEAVWQQRDAIRLLDQEIPGSREGSLHAVIDRALSQIVIGVCYLRRPDVTAHQLDRVNLVIDVGASALTTACVKLALADYPPPTSALAINMLGDFITTAFSTLLTEESAYHPPFLGQTGSASGGASGRTATARAAGTR